MSKLPVHQDQRDSATDTNMSEKTTVMRLPCGRVLWWSLIGAILECDATGRQTNAWNCSDCA